MSAAAQTHATRRKATRHTPSRERARVPARRSHSHSRSRSRSRDREDERSPAPASESESGSDEVAAAPRMSGLQRYSGFRPSELLHCAVMLGADMLVEREGLDALDAVARALEVSAAELAELMGGQDVLEAVMALAGRSEAELLHFEETELGLSTQADKPMNHAAFDEFNALMDAVPWQPEIARLMGIDVPAPAPAAASHGASATGAAPGATNAAAGAPSSAPATPEDESARAARKAAKLQARREAAAAKREEASQANAAEAARRALPEVTGANVQAAKTGEQPTKVQGVSKIALATRSLFRCDVCAFAGTGKALYLCTATHASVPSVVRDRILCQCCYGDALQASSTQ